ncbi:MAG TPA: hypothetical protein PLX02_12245 [Syntrophorhabdaceae bacterium]|nr:hypothetical protein [Syntrophorhabdaceae bacterium]HQM82381.1 hypothetical protein [Syntrophorhabdaceae bacterium]
MMQVTLRMFLPRYLHESVHCIAHLNEDIAGVLPYLNAMLGGTEYF